MTDLDAVMAIAGYDRNSIARRMSPTAVVAWDADTVAEVAARIRQRARDRRFTVLSAVRA